MKNEFDLNDNPAEQALQVNAEKEPEKPQNKASEQLLKEMETMKVVFHELDKAIETLILEDRSTQKAFVPARDKQLPTDYAYSPSSVIIEEEGFPEPGTHLTLN